MRKQVGAEGSSLLFIKQASHPDWVGWGGEEHLTLRKRNLFLTRSEVLPGDFLVSVDVTGTRTEQSHFRSLGSLLTIGAGTAIQDRQIAKLCLNAGTKNLWWGTVLVY